MDPIPDGVAPTENIGVVPDGTLSPKIFGVVPTENGKVPLASAT